ncbi:biotin--[acetyl-CoA-carboxylase] ligase [Flavobacteriales bacterium]|nr:biotin--[acetyl-CoA-carboxylase] ligase [Flavobacteriales bacterium]
MFIGNNLIELDVVDSTNNYAANLLVQTKLVSGTAIMTHFQTGGRGQRGSDWISEPGKNLLFSIVLNGHFINSENYFLLSKAVAVGINEALEDVSGKTGFVKWPNDIYIDQKKIGGILIENQWKGSLLEVAIVGIGINVNQVNFDDLQGVTSLSLLGSKNYDLKEVMAKVFEKIEFYYNLLKRGDINQINHIYFNHLMFSNEWKTYDSNNGRIEGKIIEVKENGLLVLKLRNKELMTFEFKELSFIL